VALSSGERVLDCSDGCALLKSGGGTGPAAGTEVWRTHPDGRRQPLLASAQVIRDSEGNASEIVHSYRDITRLKQADEAKTMFLATASHELKTPLSVIQGFAQTLVDDPDWDEADRRAALEAIRVRAGELNAIVDRILLSSRIDAGEARVIIAELDVGPLVEERVMALRSATGREVVASIEPDLPPAVNDPDALVTILDHLLDNAVKYSPGGERIEVRVASSDERVALSVTDHGVGMDKEGLEHCFDRFWQAESSDSRRFGGTGIGLFIVASLAAAMGASVRAASTPAAGTTFTVELRRPGGMAAATAKAATPQKGPR
jgi:signal transduction histidine kinase